MKIVIPFFVLLYFSLNLSCFAQPISRQVHVEAKEAKVDTLQKEERQKGNMIDLELAGNSFIYSIGYSFSVKPNWNIRFGFGYLDVPGVDDNHEENEPESYFRTMNIPVTASYYKKRFEFIAGLRFDKLESRIGTFKSSKWNKWYITPTAGAGYQYSANRFVIGAKITLSYVEYMSDLPTLLPGLGIKFGYKF